MVFPVCLLTRLDEITLRPVRPLDVLVPCGLRPTAVGPQWARRLAHLLDAAAGRLGQYQIEPVLREGLEVPDQRGVVRDGLAVPVRMSRRSDSIPRWVLLSAIISRQAKSSFCLEWIGGRPCCSLPDAGRGSPGLPRLASSSDEMPRFPLRVRNTASIFPVCCVCSLPRAGDRDQKMHQAGSRAVREELRTNPGRT